MANTDLALSMPDTDRRSTSTILITGSLVGGWGYSDWVKIQTMLRQPINIYSIIFQPTAIPTVDTVEQYIIEIGTGSSNNVTTIIQVPYNMKSDTAVGFYHTTDMAILPEPRTVAAGSTIYVRAACSTASRLITGISILYTSTVDVCQPQAYFNNYQRIVGGGTPMGVI